MKSEHNLQIVVKTQKSCNRKTFGWWGS